MRRVVVFENLRAVEPVVVDRHFVDVAVDSVVTVSEEQPLQAGTVGSGHVVLGGRELTVDIEFGPTGTVHVAIHGIVIEGEDEMVPLIESHRAVEVESRAATTAVTGPDVAATVGMELKSIPLVVIAQDLLIVIVSLLRVQPPFD